jgi:hypothetical protein
MSRDRAAREALLQAAKEALQAALAAAREQRPWNMAAVKTANAAYLRAFEDAWRLYPRAPGEK